MKIIIFVFISAILLGCKSDPYDKVKAKALEDKTRVSPIMGGIIAPGGGGGVADAVVLLETSEGVTCSGTLNSETSVSTSMSCLLAHGDSQEGISKIIAEINQEIEELSQEVDDQQIGEELIKEGIRNYIDGLVQGIKLHFDNNAMTYHYGDDIPYRNYIDKIPGMIRGVEGAEGWVDRIYNLSYAPPEERVEEARVAAGSNISDIIRTIRPITKIGAVNLLLETPINFDTAEINPVLIISSQELRLLDVNRPVKIFGFGSRVHPAIADQIKMVIESSLPDVAEEDREYLFDEDLNLLSMAADALVRLGRTSSVRTMSTALIFGGDNDIMVLGRQGIEKPSACSGDEGGPVIAELSNGEVRQIGMMMAFGGACNTGITFVSPMTVE